MFHRGAPVSNDPRSKASFLLQLQVEAYFNYWTAFCNQSPYETQALYTNTMADAPETFAFS